MFKLNDIRGKFRRNWLGGQLFNHDDGLTMIDNLEMLAQALATNGEPFFEDEPGFAQGESVAFNGVGVVNPFG